MFFTGSADSYLDPGVALMITKNTTPNAAQKKWMKDVAEWAEEKGGLYKMALPYGDGTFQIHHVAGRSAKQSKVAIGHWYILPLPSMLHDVASDHPQNVTHHKASFEEWYGEQCWLWHSMVNMMRDEGYEIPFSEDVIKAVLEWRR